MKRKLTKRKEQGGETETETRQASCQQRQGRKEMSVESVVRTLQLPWPGRLDYAETVGQSHPGFLYTPNFIIGMTLETLARRCRAPLNWTLSFSSGFIA